MSTMASSLNNPQALDAIAAGADAQRPAAAATDVFSPRSAAAMALSSFAAQAVGLQHQRPSALFGVDAGTDPAAASSSATASKQAEAVPSPATSTTAETQQQQQQSNKKNRDTSDRLSNNSRSATATPAASGMLRSVSLQLPTQQQPQQQSYMVPAPAYHPYVADFFPPWTPHQPPRAATTSTATLYPREAGPSSLPKMQQQPRGPSPANNQHRPLPSPPAENISSTHNVPRTSPQVPSPPTTTNFVRNNGMPVVAVAAAPFHHHAPPPALSVTWQYPPVSLQCFGTRLNADRFWSCANLYDVHLH